MVGNNVKGVSERKGVAKILSRISRVDSTFECNVEHTTSIRPTKVLLIAYLGPHSAVGYSNHEADGRFSQTATWRLPSGVPGLVNEYFSPGNTPAGVFARIVEKWETHILRSIKEAKICNE
jgi:hypothetical protein